MNSPALDTTYKVAAGVLGTEFLAAQDAKDLKEIASKLHITKTQLIQIAAALDEIIRCGTSPGSSSERIEAASHLRGTLEALLAHKSRSDQEKAAALAPIDDVIRLAKTEAQYRTAPKLLDSRYVSEELFKSSKKILEQARAKASDTAQETELEQKIKFMHLYSQAAIESHEDGKINAKQFETKLSELLGQNLSYFSKAGLAAIIADFDKSGIDVQFLEEMKSNQGHLSTLIAEMPEIKDLETAEVTLSKEGREEVLKAVREFYKNQNADLAKIQAGPQDEMIKAREKKAIITKKREEFQCTISTWDEGKRAYLKQICELSEKLGRSNIRQFVDQLFTKERFSKFISGGVIGTIVGQLIGSSFMGMALMLLINFASSADAKSSTRDAAKIA
jgi:hypothetical protein